MEKIGEDFLHSSISMRFIFYGMVWITQNPVGVDAHIDPAGCTGFTEIFGEFVTSHWADRVVGPYGEISMHSYPCRGGRLCPPAGRTAFYGNLRRIRNFPAGRLWVSAPTGLRRIRTASQTSNARRFYRRYSNAAARKSGVP